MVALTIELPDHGAQTDFNLRHWAEVLADRELAKFEGRIETDLHGHILMSPPPAPNHGSLQSEISCLLRHLVSGGRTLTECPISTADGVKAADAAWASRERLRELEDRLCFPRSPEIWVEALFASNTEAEMREKIALYFDAGAVEVWMCASSGDMSFFGRSGRLDASATCPHFSKRIVLQCATPESGSS